MLNRERLTRDERMFVMGFLTAAAITAYGTLCYFVITHGG